MNRAEDVDDCYQTNFQFLFSYCTRTFVSVLHVQLRTRILSITISVRNEKNEVEGAQSNDIKTAFQHLNYAWPRDFSNHYLYLSFIFLNLN
jgi:hypothetical protein